MADSEKITINLGPVDLGKIDLLVGEGMYATRTDFIRSAVRSQIDKHGAEVQQCVVRNSFVIGMVWYDRTTLQRLQARGARLDLHVLGSLVFKHDVPAELAAEVIERVEVRGLFNASESVKAALADRMH